jgi:hypothetical protein
MKYKLIYVDVGKSVNCRMLLATSFIAFVLRDK